MADYTLEDVESSIKIYQQNIESAKLELDYLQRVSNRLNSCLQKKSTDNSIMMPVGSKAFIPSTLTDIGTTVVEVEGKLTSMKTTDALVIAVRRVNALRSEIAKLQEAIDSLFDLKSKMVNTTIVASSSIIASELPKATPPPATVLPEATVKDLGGVFEIREEFDESFHGPIIKKPAPAAKPTSRPSSTARRDTKSIEEKQENFESMMQKLLKLERAEKSSNEADHSDVEIRFNLKMCSNCDRPNATSRCSRCKSVWYCDRNCQKLSWSAHKLHCQSKTKTKVKTTPVTNSTTSEPVISEIIVDDDFSTVNNDVSKTKPSKKKRISRFKAARMASRGAAR